VIVTESAPIFGNLPAPVADDQPRTFEQYDQAYGCIDYRTRIPAGPAALVEAPAINDIGQVYVDGQRIGFTDRRSRNFKVHLPARAAEATLDIFVEAMGRVNFGPEVHDRKGIHGPVTLGGQTLTGWQIFNLPLDDHMLAGLQYAPVNAAAPVGPAFYRATVNVATPGDCFLDMHPWGKGFAWVNGHNLGRYWNIGPQQTMYVPGPWLKAGDNEIVILDLLGAAQPVVAALDHPVLNELRPQLDFTHLQRHAPKVKLDQLPVVQTGTFAPGSGVQDVKLTQPATGRYFAIESLNAYDGGPFTSIAELGLLDENGKPLSEESWTIADVDSEERVGEDGSAENAIDGQTANFWHTEWSAAKPGQPHHLTLDLGHSVTIGGFRYTPRQGPDTVAGRIKDYRIHIGNGPQL